MDAVKAKFENLGTPSARSRLIYATDRYPPKFFVTGVPVTPPPAAEVSLSRQPGGTEVVLRLMWGPLPAPFPRALAGASILLAVLIALVAGHSAFAWFAAGLLGAMPLLALLYQRRGERVLQQQLSGVLDGASFVPKPH